MPTSWLEKLAGKLNFEVSASYLHVHVHVLFFFRVDELVKAMYTPSDSKQIEET